MDFGHSTARRFAGYSCKSPAKVHPLSETPSSFIQHVKELSLFSKFVRFTSGHTPHFLTYYFVKTHFEINCQNGSILF